jgi:hypothetical protein
VFQLVVLRRHFLNRFGKGTTLVVPINPQQDAGFSPEVGTGIALGQFSPVPYLSRISATPNDKRPILLMTDDCQLLAHYLHNHPLVTLPVKLGIEDPLPSPEIQFARGDRHDHLMMDQQSF